MNGFVVLLPWTLVLVLLLKLPDWRGPELLTLSATALGWLLAAISPLRAKLRRGVLPATVLFAVSCGMWLAGMAQIRFAPLQLQADRSYQIIGTVEGLPEQDRFGRKVRIRLACAGTDDKKCDLYQGGNQLWPVLVEVTAAHKKWPQPPLPGQRWAFKVHPAALEPEDPLATFNTARWLMANHVVARFRIRGGDVASLVNTATDPVNMARLTLRSAIAKYQAGDASNTRLSGLPVILALITGDRSLMTTDHWYVFNRTGTTHLIAISGTHIMLVAGVAIWLFNLVFKRWLWLTSRIPSLYPALLLGWLVALSYSAIAGMGFPVQRALIMLSVLVLFKLRGRALPLWLGWNLAFFLVLVWDPMAVYSIGFWLSFVAVYWIIWGSGGAVLPLSKSTRWWRLQWGIFFGLAPVLLWQLQNISLVSGGTNLLAIPMAGLLLTPLALLWALGWSIFADGANSLLLVANYLAEGLIWFLRYCADTPFSVLTTTPHSAGTMLLAFFGVVWLCTPGWPGRWLAPVLLMPLVLPAPAEPGLKIQGAGTAPRILLDTGNQMMFIARSEWPSLESRWQQNWFRWNGIPPAEWDVPLRGTAEYWRAPAWVLQQYYLNSSPLGFRKITQQHIFDLCSGADVQVSDIEVKTLMVGRRGKQCVLALEWQQQRIILFDSLGLTMQKSLLQALKHQTVVDWVLLQPGKTGRWWLPLLQFWASEGTRMLLTEEPPSLLRSQLESSGLQWHTLAESGLLSLPQ